MLFGDFCNTDLYVKFAVEGQLQVPCSLPVALLEHQIKTHTNLLKMLSPGYLHHLSVELLNYQ